MTQSAASSTVALPITGTADIELVNVRRTYGAVAAVDGVSMQVARGEFFSLLGPSGCGKTTLLRMIGGFVEPSDGEIRLRGELVNDVPPHRRATNMVFQQLALFPHLTVYDNIAFGLRVKKVPRDRMRRKVDEVLEQVGLSGYGKRWSHELSGGQQQRVAIARAVVNEPTALLLDEPLGALDAKLRVQMQLELKSMQKRLGTTFIFVTHDQGEAMMMSDRIAVMSNGKVEQIGSPAEIYGSPRTQFVANFIGENNPFSGNVTAREYSTVVVNTGGGLELRARGAEAVGTRVNLSLRPEAIRIGDRAAGLSNYFDATVEAAVNLGPTIRYELRLNDGTLLIAQAQADGTVLYHLGEHVPVGWSEDQLVLLEENPV
jgi:spermidine/putrescine transport system ATP-binding protein